MQALHFQRGRAGGAAGWMEMAVEEGEGAEQLSSLAEVEMGVEGGRRGQRGRSWKVEEHRSPGKPRSPLARA